jgi:hypothetical protein
VLLGIPRGLVVERHAFQLQAKDRPKRKLRRCRVVDHMSQPSRPPRENMENGNPVHELSRDTEPGLLAGGAEPSVSATVTDDQCFPWIGTCGICRRTFRFISQRTLGFASNVETGLDFQGPHDLKSSSDFRDLN